MGANRTVQYRYRCSFLDNRLGVTMDYFKKKTKDMLIQKPYIAAIGEGGYNGIMQPVWTIMA